MKIQPLWDYRGQKRPDFAIAPVEGQESVWDYPARHVSCRTDGACTGSSAWWWKAAAR